MTVSYSGRFGVLLFRWKASLWKSVWRSLAMYLIVYYLISLVYQFLMTEDQQITFGRLALYLDEKATANIPIAFLLGLYVVTALKRWWEQFENVSWPDNLMYFVSAFMRGDPENSELARATRRTIARYTVLSATLAWKNISSRVLNRFPTADHLVQAGLMTAEEKEIYQETNGPYGRWFIPVNWIQQIIIQWRAEGRLDAAQCNQLLTQLHNFKDKFIRQFVFDWVKIPLVYTQVCCVATYGYFLLLLIGRQNILHMDRMDITEYEAPKKNLNTYFPLFTFLELLFYLGWLKVGEELMHPFGEEDDDFELNYLLDRHLHVALMIADELQARPHPPIVKDIFWDQEPVLPHTKASGRIKDRKPGSHTHSLLFQEMELNCLERQETSARLGNPLRIFYTQRSYT